MAAVAGVVAAVQRVHLMMRRKQSPPGIVLAADEPVSYRLLFRAGRGEAKLTSPHLDRAMHARAGVRVAFESLRGPDAGATALDPFEAQSLVEYLQTQEAVRRELERRLDELLERWDDEREVGRGHDVWGQTKIDAVTFTPRRLATAEQVRHIKKKYKGNAGQVLRMGFDTIDSRSSFTVFMMPEWAEHQLVVQFRDGVALELLVEG